MLDSKQCILKFGRISVPTKLSNVYYIVIQVLVSDRKFIKLLCQNVDYFMEA